jgi:hypothetical protein
MHVQWVLFYKEAHRKPCHASVTDRTLKTIDKTWAFSLTPCLVQPCHVPVCELAEPTMAPTNAEVAEDINTKRFTQIYNSQ